MSIQPGTGQVFSPQYFIISRTEPQYDLIRKHLLDSSPLPHGSSHYFIRAGRDNCCICRIKACNDTVLFYEILNHLRMGISDEDIRNAVACPSCISPLPDYFSLTPEIERKLQAVHRTGNW